MGTRFDLVVAGLPPEEGELLFRDIRQEIERIEGLISIHRSDSLFSFINAHAHKNRIPLETEMQDLFATIREMHEQTGGRFDITLAPLGEYLKEHQESQKRIPDELMEKSGMDKVDLSRGGIRFATKGVCLDPGGFGKGYAVKQILPLIHKRNVEHALVSFGESLVYALGNHPYGEAWKIVLPGERDHPAEFFLKDEALSVSGNSLNNRKKFANSGHIIDPLSFRINTKDALVCVVHEDPLKAEIYSTALFSGMSADNERPEWAAGLHMVYLEDH